MISEILDKLSIIIIRITTSQIVKEDRTEINEIEKKLKKFFLKKKIKKEYIFYLNLLILINYEIWKTKDKMFNKKGNFKKNELKLSHQINSIRNIIKNKIETLNNPKKFTIKSNVDKEDLKGWDLQLLSNRKYKSKPKIQRDANIAEYLDFLTILQIKEKRFYDTQSKKLLINYLNNFKTVIDGNNFRILYAIAFLASINNFVWDIKNKIVKKSLNYHSGLANAQNLNSLRNEIKNYINFIFNNKSVEKTGIFYEASFYEKLIFIRDCFKIVKITKKEKFNHITLFEIKKLILNKNEQLEKIAENIYKPNNFIYYPTEKFRDQIIKDIIDKIQNKKFWISGKNKVNIWQKGWGENFKNFSKNKNSKNLIPKFLSKKLPLRFGNRWIKPQNKNLEFNVVEIYRTHIFKKYFKMVDNVYEFGCGSSQHLIRLNQIYPQKKIIGLDWSNASIKIINSLKNKKKINIQGFKFNLFKPNYKIKIKPNSAIFTVGTMEQLGTDYTNFYKYIIVNKPKIVIHFETIEELYNENLLFDYLAKIYDNKRNYLKGYLTFLQKKEKEKKIKILRLKKFNFGSMMHDSYSSIIWKPL